MKTLYNEIDRIVLFTSIMELNFDFDDIIDYVILRLSYFEQMNELYSSMYD